MSRKHLLLIALLAILALAIGYAFLMTPRQQTIDPGRADIRQQQSVRGKDQQVSASSARLRLDWLGEEPTPFPGAQRDIFTFREKPAVNAPSTAPAALPSVTSPAPLPPAATSSAVVPEPLSSFTFLGFLEIAGDQIVFLSSADEIYLVRQGERFGRDLEFEAKDIADNVLTVARRGRTEIEKVLLVEKEKPDSSVSAPARIAPLPAPVVEESHLPPGVSAPARRGGVSASPGLSGVPRQLPEETNSRDLQNLEPLIDMENPEGEVHGAN